MREPSWIGRSLYVGNLYVGEVMRIVPEHDWRESNKPNHQDDDIVAKNKTRMIAYYTKHEAKPWRAWFMNDDEGNPIGYYATEDDARKALESHLADAIQ